MQQKIIASIVMILFVLTGCVQPESEKETTRAGLPPEPEVTHADADIEAGKKIAHGEMVTDVEEARRQLHAQHHPHMPLETRSIPGEFDKPAMNSVTDFALTKDDLVTINPGPGEFVYVMEGQRHGYQNLTVGITYTAPGGAPPMHTHVGEESHVLLEGRILYALGDEIFAIEAPYMVNIPPMVPHSFQNLGDSLAELVVIFPTNVWEYDVLDYFPFSSPEAKALAERAKRGEGLLNEQKSMKKIAASRDDE